MPTLGDYLEMTPQAAREQWRSIQDRRPATNRRQVNFVPVETLLCLAASLLVNHRRYGGSTSHQAEEPVPALARLFRRNNSSVLAKMANLDGSRPNGAKHEIEVAAEFLAAPERLIAAYRRVLAAARDVGIGGAELPDFLAAEDADLGEPLLGQDELDQAQLESEVQPALASWLRQRPDLDQSMTERLLVAVTRVGQHRFASDVLRNHGHRCVFCGLTVASSGGAAARRMLLASHIKPWRASTARERTDPRNGLCACPTHDVAFDTGLLTVNGGLRIHVSSEVRTLAETDPAARAAFGRPPLGDRLRLPTGAVPPNGTYLAWHYEHIYQGVAEPVI